MGLDKFPINAFDLFLLVVLLAGLLSGRKRGMSEELLGLLKWVGVILGSAMMYEPGAHFLAESSPFGLLASFIIVYITLGILILGVFSLFKHSLGGKLIGSDFFGRAEYYLGMGSGMVRFTCMLLAVLALLNARYFSPQEVLAREKVQNEDFGSNFFPGLPTLQSVVFEKSLTGPWIKQNLGFLLIKPTRLDGSAPHQKDANIAF
jgi:uncharacterized membrane protein required for colicin V production